MGINFEELREGMVLEKNILRKDGALILNKGTKLTNGIIARLRKLNDNIKFEEDKTQDLDEVEETVDANLRNDTENSISEFLTNPTEAQVQKIKENANEIVERTTKTDDPQYDLNVYSEEDGTASHAVRVAFFSILLAKIYNDNLQTSNKQALINLNDIAVAALLQDAGIMYKDDKRLAELAEVQKTKGMEELFPGIKETPLDHYDEKYSSVYSYCAVADRESISNSAKLMVLLSKEPENGNGPLKMPTSISSRRNNILYGAKIINVCSVYDNAMKRAIDNNTSLEDVISELGHCAINGMISNEIKELLINKVKLYPYKTRVLLSNGEVATVETSRFGQYDSYKPVVRTCSFPRRRIDLKENINTTIKSIVSKDKFKGLVEQQIKDMKDIAGVSDSER